MKNNIKKACENAVKSYSDITLYEKKAERLVEKINSKPDRPMGGFKHDLKNALNKVNFLKTVTNPLLYKK